MEPSLEQTCFGSIRVGSSPTFVIKLSNDCSYGNLLADGNMLRGCSSSSFSAAANCHARMLRSAPSSIVNRGHVECGAHWRTHILISGHAINSSTDTSLLAFGGKFWGDEYLPSKLYFRHCIALREAYHDGEHGRYLTYDVYIGVGNWLITTRNVCQKKYVLHSAEGN
jgi:hypothetical protein